MTPIVLVLAAAALTYTSRAAALTVLPPPSRIVAPVIERIPAPLFAGLAVLTLLGPGLDTPSTPVLIAATAAAIATLTRSLATIVATGITAYAAALWIL